MNKTYRILICDDDPIVHQSLSLYLDNEEFEHDSAFTGNEALDMLKKAHYDLMLLDQMMPGISGMEVCQTVRKTSQIPIIMLTARGEEIDRILGLEMGADDYIVKPFSPREVISRIKAVLRRTAPQEESSGAHAQESMASICYGTLEIQPERYSVRLKGQPIACTPREVELLTLLITNPGRVFDREQILSRIWGYDFFGDTRTVDTHIKRLRQKLTCDEMGTIWDIVTVYGKGYKFEVIS
ncbi:MAG: response regulator transcription factor [Clostridia bacterium]|nr:response regulator transcription factor [Clostridia bacterium]